MQPQLPAPFGERPSPPPPHYHHQQQQQQQQTPSYHLHHTQQPQPTHDWKSAQPPPLQPIPAHTPSPQGNVPLPPRSPTSHGHSPFAFPPQHRAVSPQLQHQQQQQQHTQLMSTRSLQPPQQQHSQSPAPTLQSSHSLPTNFASMNLGREVLRGLGNMNQAQMQSLVQSLSQQQLQQQGQQQQQQQQSPSFSNGASYQSQSSHHQQIVNYHRETSRTDEMPSPAASPPPPHSSPAPVHGNYPRSLSQLPTFGRSEQNVTDSPSSNWSLAQVQQLQQQILQLTKQRGEQSVGQHVHSPLPPQHTQQAQGQQSGPPPLMSAPSITRPSSITSGYEESPRSVYTTMSSPASRSGYGSGYGFSSTFSSPFDSVRSRSHSRSISSALHSGMNPHANEFNPTFSTPSSPTITHMQGGHANSPSSDRRAGYGRAASSTPTIGGGGFSSSSPPSSGASGTRSIDSNFSGPLSPLAQQQQQQINDEKLAALGLPSQPFDARELDAQIARERDDHAAYIYNFRVQVCQGYLDGNCPYDAYSCFQTHARLPRRRKPILQHGRFNYIPTRWSAKQQAATPEDGAHGRYVIEEKECPQGVHCRFSHVTEEVIYHASKFKTQLCTHPIDKEGRCGGYGSHCAKAHGPLDLRQPVFESTDDGSARATPQDYFDFVCPPAQRELERKYYMYVYKTKKCLGFPFNCSCDGLDYHREEERRRGPTIKYAPMACPFVKPYLNAEWSKPNVDCSGRFKPKVLKNGQLVPQESDEWDCEYAHTLLELMYHPQVYKTGACDHFDEDSTNTWKCVWKRRCAHSHGRDDIRTKEEATEDWRVHLLSAFPNATSLPNLTRLLSAGQAALENLNSGLSKSRGGMSAPPSAHPHRRSVTMSREQAQAMQGRGTPQSGSMGQQHRHLTYQQQQQQPQNVYEVDAGASPHGSQQMRAPLHIMSSGAPSHMQQPPPQMSPHHAQQQQQQPPLPSPKSSGLGLGGLAGFFSGSDTSLWSPKGHMPGSSGPIGSNTMSSNLAQSRMERFVFESGGAGGGPRTDALSDPAMAWAVDEGGEKPSLARGGSLNLTGQQAPLLLMEDGKPVTLSEIDVPRAIIMPSTSPDSIMPTSVAQTLWTATPIAPAVMDWRAQLAMFLQCASCTSAESAHMLHQPVSTPCCGVSICQRCVDAHLAQCRTTIKVPSEQQTEADTTSSSTIDQCVCGHTLVASDVEQLRRTPVNKTLEQLCQWVRQADTDLAAPMSETTAEVATTQ